MGLAYENQRVIFNAMVKKYNEYVALYKAINHGSLEGVTPFSQFYWHFTYVSRYSPNNPTGRP